MKSRILCVLLLLAGVLTAGEMPGRQTYPKAPESVQAQVQTDVAKAPAQWKGVPLAYYAVSSTSDIPQLSDRYPVDATAYGDLLVVAAKNEFEPASAVFYPMKDVDKFLPVATDLVSAKGAKIPASAVDIKLVKLWYQAGSAWYSQYNDTLKMKLIPEILLNDEKMIYADTKTEDNYIRYYNCDGSVSYQWMTARFPVVNYDILDLLANTALIADADTLQPAVLNRHEFKQYVFTVHVPKDAADGVYTGKINLNADGKIIGSIPLKVRVLPFELPAPKTYYDLSKGFYLSLYATETSNPKVIQNMVNHNMLNPMGVPYIDPFKPEKFKRNVDLARKHGINLRPLFSAAEGVYHRMPPEPKGEDLRTLNNIKRIIQETRELSLAVLGHTDFYSYAADEGGPDTIRMERAVWKIAHSAGGKVMVSCTPHGELLVGLDYMLKGEAPTADSYKIVEDFHRMNPGNLCGWYADPHGGPENPYYARRAHGIQTWRTNFDVACNYAWMRNNWNDAAIPYEPNYRGIVMVYGGRDGNFDTVQWEGVREGLDDVRYASYMQQLAVEAAASKDVDVSMLGRRALARLAYMDQFRDALDPFRMECIQTILSLRKALKIQHPNEAEMVKGLNGIVVGIVRDATDVRNLEHKSEIPLDGKYVDETILNNGSLDDLRKSILEILKRHVISGQGKHDWNAKGN